MNNLYEIQAEILNIFRQLDDDNLQSDILDALLADLDVLSTNRDIKLLNCWKYIRSLELESESIKTELDRLKEKRESVEKRTERIKTYVSNCLANRPWKSGAHAFDFRKSTAVVQAEGIETPSAYCRIKTVVEPDKKLIKETITCGGTVPGWRIEERLNLQVK